jgi:hypothetical protein
MKGGVDQKYSSATRFISTENGNPGRWIFILFCLIYLLTAKGYLESSDTEFSLRTARAIVEDFSLSIKISPEEAERVYLTESGLAYSWYGIGLPLLFIPFVLAGNALASLAGMPEAQVIGFLISFYSVPFGAGTCVIVFRLVKLFGADNRTALETAVLLGLATLCWRYSGSDFSEMAQLFLLSAAVYGVLRNTTRSLVAGSLALFWLLLLKAASVVFLPAFAGYILFRNRPINRQTLRRVGAYFSLVFLAGGLLLLLNYLRFGNPLETGYGVHATEFYPARLPMNTVRLLVSLNKGLLVYSPIILAGLLGYRRFFRMFRQEATFFASLIGLNLCVSAMYGHYGGGWSWGPRLLIPTLALWLLPLHILLGRRGWARGMLMVLACVSCLVQLVGVLQKAQEYHQIRYNLVPSDVRSEMPADIIGSAVILRHKLLRGDNVYRLAEFGVRSQATIDTGRFETFRGLNLWYCHLARHFRRPLMRYVPLLFLPALAVCLHRLRRAVHSPAALS